MISERACQLLRIAVLGQWTSRKGVGGAKDERARSTPPSPLFISSETIAADRCSPSDTPPSPIFLTAAVSSRPHVE